MSVTTEALNEILAPWEGAGEVAIRRERHFGDRVFACFRDRPKNVHALLVSAVYRNPDGEALVDADTGVRLTYRSLGRAVDRLAAGLASLGLTAGDRLAILTGNRPEFFVAVLAANRIGVTSVPLNIRMATAELEYVLNDCGAKAVLHEAELAMQLPVADTVPDLEHRISIGGDGGGDGGGDDGDAVAYADIADHDPAELASLIDDEEAVVLIMYTSGTTGRPKGAMIAHINIVHSVMHYQLGYQMNEVDRSMLVVPASHISGLIGILFALLRAGGCTVMMNSFNAERFLDVAVAERMTHTILVPAMYNLCLLRPDFAERDLSHWRVGIYGGAPMPQATIEGLAKALPALQLSNAYGSTETTSPATLLPLGEALSRADSVGRVVHCCRIVVVDDQGREVPPGEEGEIWISGPMVVQGYWGKPEATAENFVAGHWTSGDVGSMDEQGYLRVFDRKKDMINRAGYKIYSVEVENVLSYHDSVVEAAVVPKPCPVLGERVHCFLVPKQGGADTGAVQDFCAERLSDYKVPESFTLLTEPLPRNANGKILKRTLVEMLMRELEG